MAAVGLEAQICNALLLRLAALTLSPALPVAWPDSVFTPPMSGATPPKPLPYLEATLLQAPTLALGISHSGFNAYTGLLQVTVVYPQNSGALKSQEIAAKIITWFKRGTKMADGTTTVRIILPPYASPSYQDAPYTRTPVTVRYQAFAKQT